MFKNRRWFGKKLSAVLACGLLACLILCRYALAADIAVYGDSQDHDAAQRKVVQAIVPFKPSIVFRVGDIVSDGDDPREWKTFNDIHEPLLKTTEYFPALGNHDKGSALYFANFPYLKGRRWYSVDREGIHFIVLDSNSKMDPGSKQYDWLVSDLKGAGGAKFRIVLFHHPIFGVGKGHEEDEKGLKAILLPIFEKYKVSAVFSGHEHSYQRSEYKGIYFIVTGGGGAHLRGQGRESPYLKKFRKTRHFCLISTGHDSLRIRVIDADSKVIDEFTVFML